MQTAISKLFRDTRERYKLSQEQFCKLIPCSRVSLSMYETGETVPGANKFNALLQLRAKFEKR
jgi:transcriptional regulator with XRE-family HTH domain